VATAAEPRSKYPGREPCYFGKGVAPNLTGIVLVRSTVLSFPPPDDLRELHLHRSLTLGVERQL